MTFTTIEEFLAYLEKAYSTSTEERTGDVASEEVTFDYNAKAVNVLFRNAMNEKHFSVAYDILVYANEREITLTKGH